MRAWILAVSALLLLLASCSGTGPKQAPKGIFRPYTVKGKTYHPLKDGHGWHEEGYASWYEPGWFSGRTTANGERLRSGELTCAHRVLPMNTMVTVVNLENGREVTVRVNDRGPFVSGRCIDLTEAGAKALGFHGKGKAKVSLSTSGGVPGMEDGRLPGPFFVQVGAFAVEDNARALAASLGRRGFGGTRIERGGQTGQLLWRVQAGQFASVDEAASELERLSPEFPDAVRHRQIEVQTERGTGEAGPSFVRRMSPHLSQGTKTCGAPSPIPSGAERAALSCVPDSRALRPG